ncbi:MAG: DUF115 domain-containing protein, partial [Lachnospiraceae bacterium]|nr:DUF115 domain-containing protein [Lachnospiraceae bacterium]
LKNVKPYNLEETNVGYATVALTDSLGNYYFHSNVDPVWEARALIEDYYVPKCENYIMIGAGLGYGARELLKKNQFSKVTVYEHDARMLKSMISYIDFSKFIDNGRLTIILDDKFEHLTKALEAEDTVVVMHEPSIRNVKDDLIRNQLYMYFYKESGLRKSSELMESNFYQNYRNCRSNVDELESAFSGKKVVIVAAGPSASKHYEALRNRPDDVVIVAVTTIYKKLLAEGIKPDYIVHIDTSSKTVLHIKGVDDDTPLLVLSTAYEGCARVHEGRSYIVYQKGYNLAEEKAMMGYKLYETGGSVTCVALDVAVQLKAKEVILIGLDLAYTGGLIHAEGSHSTEHNNEADISNAYMVKGYYGDPVPSTLVFDGFIRWFSDYARRHPDANIINSTEGGADIANIKKMPFKEALEL